VSVKIEIFCRAYLFRTHGAAGSAWRLAINVVTATPAIAEGDDVLSCPSCQLTKLCLSRLLSSSFLRLFLEVSLCEEARHSAGFV